MRIAIVTHFAPPQPAVAAHRVLRMSRALLAAGHEVHWVTLDTEQLLAVDSTLAASIPPEVVVHGLGAPSLYSRPAAPGFWSKVARTIAFELPRRFPAFDGHFEWTHRIKRNTPRIVAEHGIEAVLVCCGPHGQIAILPKLRKRHPDLRIFVDYRDLLSGNPWNERPSQRLRDGVQKRERRVLGAANVLFLNTSEARNRFRSVFGEVDGLELDVMRNAADYELADSVFERSPPVELGQGVHFGFFGTLFPQRRLHEVLTAMSRLSPHELDHVTLHCYCDDRQSPQLLAEDLDKVGPAVAARVRRHEFLPYGDALRTMHAMHGLVLVNSPDERDSVFVPGKLYDYLMARRPVLFVGSPGDASTIVSACGGHAFEYGSAPALCEAMRLIIRNGDSAITTERNPNYAPEQTFAPLLDRLK